MKKIILSLLAIVVMSMFFANSALAWNYNLSGSEVCNSQTGNHDITWTIDNTTEVEAFTVTSSNRLVVPVGSVAPASSSANFTESLPGATLGLITLTLDGGWPSDPTPHQKTKEVLLDGTCRPPLTPTQPPNVGGPGDGKSDGLGCASRDCSNQPSNSQGGQVLGASTGPQVLGLSTTSGNENSALIFAQLFVAFIFSVVGFKFLKKNA